MERYPDIQYPGNVSGILYEPRAIWSIDQVDTATQLNGRVTFPRNDFKNASKYPIILTKLLLAPVNYLYRETQNGAPIDPTTYHAGGAPAVNFSRILIDAPQRQNYSRQTLFGPSWPGQPTWEPQMRGVDLDCTGVEVQYPSSLWGVTRWDFDHPMIIPKLGTLELQLSPFNVTTVPVDPLNLRQVDFTVIVNEGPPAGSAAPGRFGNFPGNARTHPRSILRYADGFSPLRTSGQGGVGGLQSQQRQIADPFGLNTYGVPAAVLSTIQWPSDQQLSAREYDAQNATEAGSTPVEGFGVQIDQIDYDDVTINQFGPSAAGSPVSPLSLRVASRARTRNGGTGEWWWRPGAPLALVCPTLTPALVYKLPKPITLAPGDTLDVELEVQRPITIGINTIAQSYNVGISFTGYAAIEG